MLMRSLRCFLDSFRMEAGHRKTNHMIRKLELLCNLISGDGGGELEIELNHVAMM